jgi:hypothetical protein
MSSARENEEQAERRVTNRERVMKRENFMDYVAQEKLAGRPIYKGGPISI